MKILMLGWELPPANTGGLGVACYYLCRNLADAGVSIDFVLPYALPAVQSPQFMRVHAAPCEPQPLVGTYDSWSTELRRVQDAYLQVIQTLLNAQVYDAIHAHDWLTYQAGVRAKRLTGLPLVAHVHSTEYDRAGGMPGNPLAHEIEQTTLLMADRIVAVSNATKSQLVQRYGLAETLIDVVYSASDAELVHTTQTAHTSYSYLRSMQARGYKVVVSLSRLTVQKGLRYLLAAAQRALTIDQKLLFLIVGDGEQRDELIGLSAELGISRQVLFTGFLRGKAWRDAYAIGDMFIMSSVSEPYGLSALEAASAGNAVLLTKQSGVSEVLRNALQFDFWDTERLSDAIVNVAQHDTLRATLAINAMQEVRTISWRRAAEQLTAIYQTVGSPV